MARNRGMASIVGPLHELNLQAFKDAARRQAIDVAKRDGLESPWVVEVVVYNDVGPPYYLATVSEGTLIAWKEMPIGDLDGDHEEDGTLVVGFSHQELEAGLAEGEFVVLEERDSDLGRVKIAVMAEFGDAYIVEWRDPERDGNWVWIRTTQVRGGWMSTMQTLIASKAAVTRERRRRREGGDRN